MEQATQKSSNTPVILGALALGGWLFYRKVIMPRVISPIRTVKYVKRLRVTVPGVKFQGNDVKLDLFIQNPNPNPIKIDAIVGDLYVTYNGKKVKVGNVHNYPRIVLRPIGETNIWLTVETRMLPMVAYFSDVFAGKISHQSVLFDGTVTVDGVPWPVRESKKIS